MCGVIDLGRGPGRLRLAEQLEELAIRQLAERLRGDPRAQRREMRHAAAPARTRPVLEDESKLVAAVHGYAAGRIYLPALALHGHDATSHGYACDVVAT